MGDLPRLELFARQKQMVGMCGATRLYVMLKSVVMQRKQEVVYVSDNWVVQNLEKCPEHME